MRHVELASQPGIEAAPPTLEGPSPNQRTTSEVPRQELLINTEISRKTYDEKWDICRLKISPCKILAGYKRYRNLTDTILLCCAKSCSTLCDSMDCSPPGSSVCGILQARILERVTISYSRYPNPGNEPGSPALQAVSLQSEPPSPN